MKTLCLLFIFICHFSYTQTDFFQKRYFKYNGEKFFLTDSLGNKLNNESYDLVKGIHKLNGEYYKKYRYDEPISKDTLYYSSPDRFGCLPVKRLNKWGGIDSIGNIKIDFIFDTIFMFNQYGLHVKKDFLIDEYGYESASKSVLMNYKGLKLAEYDNILMYAFGTAMASKDGWYGIIDTTGKPLTEFIYECTSWDYKNFHSMEGLHVLKRNDGFCGIINSAGEIILPFEFEDITDFIEEGHLTKIKKEGKYGYINHKGIIVIQPMYDEIFYSDKKDTLLVSLNGQNGYVDMNGNPCGKFIKGRMEAVYVHNQEMDKSQSFKVYIINDSAKNYIVDSSFEPICDLMFDSIKVVSFETYGFAKGLIGFLGNDSYIISSNGLKVKVQGFRLNPSYNAYSKEYSLDNQSWVKLNDDAYNMYDLSKDKLIFSYNVTSYHEDRVSIDLIKFNSNGKIGWMTKDYEVFIKPIYDKACNFDSRGYAYVEKNGKPLVICINGNVFTEKSIVEKYNCFNN